MRAPERERGGAQGTAHFACNAQSAYSAQCALCNVQYVLCNAQCSARARAFVYTIVWCTGGPRDLQRIVRSALAAACRARARAHNAERGARVERRGERLFLGRGEHRESKGHRAIADGREVCLLCGVLTPPVRRSAVALSQLCNCAFHGATPCVPGRSPMGGEVQLHRAIR